MQELSIYIYRCSPTCNIKCTDYFIDFGRNVKSVLKNSLMKNLVIKFQFSLNFVSSKLYQTQTENVFNYKVNKH